MRKIVCILVFALFFILTSCSGGKAQDVLWYQNAAAEIAGTYESGTTVYALTVTLAAMPPEGERDVTVAYTAPKELAGMVFRLRGGEIFAVYDTLEIPLTKEAGEGFFAPARMFALEDTDITEIITVGREATQIRIANENDVWEVVTDAEGIPEKITATVDGKAAVFTVASFVQTDE